MKERSKEGAKTPHCKAKRHFFCLEASAAEAWLCSIRQVEEALDEASVDDMVSDSRKFAPLFEELEGSEEPDFEGPATLNFSTAPFTLEEAASLEP